MIDVEISRRIGTEDEEERITDAVTCGDVGGERNRDFNPFISSNTADVDRRLGSSTAAEAGFHGEQCVVGISSEHDHILVRIGLNGSNLLGSEHVGLRNGEGVPVVALGINGDDRHAASAFIHILMRGCGIVGAPVLEPVSKGFTVVVEQSSTFGDLKFLRDSPYKTK